MQKRSIEEFKGIISSVPRYWNAGNPVATRLSDAVLACVPKTEAFIIETMNQFVRCQGFKTPAVTSLIAEEGRHIKYHQLLNDRLTEQGVSLQELEKTLRNIHVVLHKLPLSASLAYVCVIEYTIYLISIRVLDNTFHVVENAHPVMQELFTEHATDEKSHGRTTLWALSQHSQWSYIWRIALFPAVVTASLLMPIGFAFKILRDDGYQYPAAIRLVSREIRWFAKIVDLGMLKEAVKFLRPGFHYERAL